MDAERFCLPDPRSDGEAPKYGALCEPSSVGWLTLRNRRLSAGYQHCKIDLILMHEDHGVALMIADRGGYTFSDFGILSFREALGRVGFHTVFPGHLPVVFVSISPSEAKIAIGKVLAAFADEEPISIDGRGWTALAMRAALEPERARDDPWPAPMRAPPQDGPSRRRRLVSAAARWGGGTVAAVAATVAIMTLGRPFFGDGPLPAERTATVAAGMHIAPDREADGVSGNTLATAYQLIPEASRITPAPPAGGAETETRSEAEARRLLSSEATASYLGLDPATFRARYWELRLGGFPAPEPITGNFDRAAIDIWLDSTKDRALKDRALKERMAPPARPHSRTKSAQASPEQA
jgi:hypothetical protein